MKNNLIEIIPENSFIYINYVGWEVYSNYIYLTRYENICQVLIEAVGCTINKKDKTIIGKTNLIMSNESFNKMSLQLKSEDKNNLVKIQVKL